MLPIFSAAYAPADVTGGKTRCARMTNTRTKSVPPLRAAAIGTGKISAEHLRYLSGAGARAGVSKLVGVCDLSPSMANFAAEEFGADGAFTDYAKMLADAKPDVVHILTPPHTHARLVADCLDRGAHVIVEKPVAPTHDEFLSLWERSQRTGRRLIEDHNYRFNEPILAIEKLLADGKLGDVREVEVRMALAVRDKGSRYMDQSLPHPSHRLPCGIIHEFITHLCYLALRFMPKDAAFDRVAAAWSKHGSDALFKFDDLDATVITGDVHARLRFTSHAAPDCFAVTVRGSKGYAETDLFQPHLRVAM
ncbi:MAG TPA: Gfo/Idh/MocA family oxidoreductase, partial [Tepidisphaeraceae bacterium]|nr:Gfo/Idh/MocA family oxidoreductase [Tepidisphaeraceae bacterium]